MADRDLKPENVDQPELGSDAPTIAWEPPSGLRRRPVRRGEFLPRRPR